MRTFLLSVIVCCFCAVFTGCSGTGHKTDSGDGSSTLASPVLKAGDATESSLTFYWEPVDNADGYVYKLDDGADMETSSTEITLNGLEPETLYTVSVKSTCSDNRYGDSPWASISIRTEAQSGMFAFSFRTEGYDLFCKVMPKDGNIPYYYYFMTQEKWDSFPTPQDVVDYKIEQIKDIAADLGTTYPEILLEEKIRYDGESEAFFGSAEYDVPYVAYALPIYDDGTAGEIEWVSFAKDFPEMSSSASVRIEFSDQQSSTIHSRCIPDGNTEWFYQVMLETAQAEAEWERVGEREFIKELLSVQQSGRLQGEVEEDWINLSPATSYTLYTVGYDYDGRIFLNSGGTMTMAVLIDSEIFRQLVGEWQGVQTFQDAEGVRAQSQFTMTVSETEGDFNYRIWNQLVCKIDGYTSIPSYGRDGIPYYSPEELMNNGFNEERAYAAFGPKLILTINELDQIRIHAGDVFYGWSELGDVYMMGADADYSRLDDQMTVLYNPSGPMLTIRCSYSGYYPSLYTRTESGWMIHNHGVSDILLYKVSR